jgi:zinc transport system permease protein
MLLIPTVFPALRGKKMTLDIFKLTFMQYAFLAGIMLSVVLAVVSFFVVLRRLSFIGVGVAHSAFGGVALGALLGISPTITAVAFAVAVSNAIGYISRRGKLSADRHRIFFPWHGPGVIFIDCRSVHIDFSDIFSKILAITQDLMRSLFGGLVLCPTFLLFKEMFSSPSIEKWLVAECRYFLDHFC